jgi:hypothetical protein
MFLLAIYGSANILGEGGKCCVYTVYDRRPIGGKVDKCCDEQIYVGNPQYFNKLRYKAL